MDLERVSRGLELAVCLAWIVAFSVRLRSVRLGSGREAMRQPLRAALRPIQFGAWTLVALSLVLQTTRSWQPYAHDLFMPSLLAGWIASLVTAVDVRRGERSRTTASEPT